MRDFLKDMLDQAWTILGMFIAWLVLEGSAKTVTGWLILLTIAIWIATYPLRRDRNEDA
jgi:hypothetical protein